MTESSALILSEVKKPYDKKENEMETNEKMAMTPKGLKFLLIGLLVMVSGYILMMGGGSDDPEVFN